MEFFRDNVLISTSQPPEEMLPSIAGSCGLWQILVVTVCFISQFFGALDVMALVTSIPDTVKFVCADGSSNGSQCINANGTKCKNFIFSNPYNVVTFTEQFNLVCDDAAYTIWIKNWIRLGLMCGCFITGICADKFGSRNTTMMFITFQAVTGLLILGVINVDILIFFVFTRGLFCSAVTLIPLLAVCNVVGNKCRTLALGVVNFAAALAVLLFASIYSLFNQVWEVIALISFLPLIILVPLLFYKDSPNYLCLMVDYVKGEKVLRWIANFNRNPLAPNAKITPVKILLDKENPKKSTFSQIWKSEETRKIYLSIMVLWFFTGYCTSIIMHFSYVHFTKLYYFGLCGVFGYAVATALCHFIPHKIVIGVFVFLRSLCIAGLIMCEVIWDKTTGSSFLVLQMVGLVFFWIAAAASVNITPRIFPTELRGVCVGVCETVFHFGHFLATIMYYYTEKTFWVTGAFFLLSPILEPLACFWLWNVHNRELPDYLSDCIRFNTYYKPTRYHFICDEPGQEETEVEVVQLNKFSYQV